MINRDVGPGGCRGAFGVHRRMRFVPSGVPCHDPVIIRPLRVQERHRTSLAHCPTFVLVVRYRAVRGSKWVAFDGSRLVIIHGKGNHEDVVYRQFGFVDTRTHPA